MNKYSTNIVFIILLFSSLSVSAIPNEKHWNTVLKPQYYPGKLIQESNDIIQVDLPYRAENPALVPLKIISKIKQTKSKYIKKITVFVDQNPYPFVGEFQFTPETGKADLSMQIRVNSYSYIRAIAQMNNGKMYMSKKFVKASGGCSAPLKSSLDTMKHLGKMKFKLDKFIQIDKANLAQLFISHPNITGMQIDQVTRFIKKSYFVDKLKVTFNGKPVLTAKVDIAISANPNFRFYFVPNKSGVLKAEFSDISCETPNSRKVCAKGESYSTTHKIEL